jgi:hypothetical protein
MRLFSFNLQGSDVGKPHSSVPGAVQVLLYYVIDRVAIEIEQVCSLNADEMQHCRAVWMLMKCNTVAQFEC